jgi:AraC-like DNA-binding protein
MRFNKLLGLGPIQANSNLIEGAETRMLEGHSSSMTTATETYGITEYKPQNDGEPDADDPVNRVDTKIIKRNNQLAKVEEEEEPEKETAIATMTAMNMSDFSMLDAMDQQLIKNIEQYVMQNMSRGQISLEELATAMGMGRVPFFHRIRSLTAKTPAELIRDMRLKHACILLKRTNINMSELATNVGFMTAENFINIFKDKFGMTPLEYRLKHRK